MKFIGNYISEFLIVLGCVLILIGVYRICPTATWFVAGLMLIVFGVLIDLSRSNDNDDYQQPG